MIPKFVKTGHAHPAPNARKVDATWIHAVPVASPSIPIDPSAARPAAIVYGRAVIVSVRTPQNSRHPMPNAAPRLSIQPARPSLKPASTPDATVHDVSPPAANARNAPPTSDHPSARRVEAGRALRKASILPGTPTTCTATSAKTASTTPSTKVDRHPRVRASRGTVAPLTIAADGMPDCLRAIARPSRGSRALVRARFTAVWFSAFTAPHNARSATIVEKDCAAVAISDWPTIVTTRQPVS